MDTSPFLLNGHWQMPNPRPKERANHTTPARKHMTILVSIPVDIGLTLTQAQAVIKGAFPPGSGIKTMQYKPK